MFQPGTIRNIVGGFLERCAIPYPMIPYDVEFFRLSCEEAARRGYPLEGKNSLKPFIPGGVAIATTAYAHIEDLPTRIAICLFTACAIYADDMFHNNAAVVDEFNERFVQNQTQADVILEAFAELIREMAVHFKRVVANIIVTSTLNGVTALLLEYETQGMKVSIGSRSCFLPRLMHFYSSLRLLIIMLPSLDACRALRRRTACSRSLPIYLPLDIFRLSQIS